MKHLRKISVLLLALIMVLTMGASVFAKTGPDNTDGNFGPNSEGKGESTGGNYVITQEDFTSAITEATFNVHFEKKDSNANLPKTKFTYSIANGTAVPASSTSPAINAGVTGGATMETPETAAWNSPNATTEVDTVKLSFDKSKFSQPGIYRYILTEAAMTAEQEAIDIKDGDKADAHTENTLYLDVYVSNVNSEKSVVAAVLSTSTAAPTLSDEQGTIANTLETATYTTKTDGFYNHFETYQVVLKKTVTGSMGDKSKFFPFDLNLGYAEGADANTTISGVKVNVAVDEGATKGSGDYAIGDESGSTYSDITIKDAGTVTITGLPKKTIMKMKETITEGEGYNISSVVTGMADSTNLDPAVKVESDFVTKGTVNGTAGANIEYTNNRTSISPTNVVMRYAPYLFILGGAALLLVVSRRRKAEQE